jgi:hypothetical protein
MVEIGQHPQRTPVRKRDAGRGWTFLTARKRG